MIHTTHPGDICNARGDIRGDETTGEPTLITSGRAIVTNAQAIRANDYGWQMLRAEPHGMMTITRPE